MNMDHMYIKQVVWNKCIYMYTEYGSIVYGHKALTSNYSCPNTLVASLLIPTENLDGNVTETKKKKKRT